MDRETRAAVAEAHEAAKHAAEARARLRRRTKPAEPSRERELSAVIESLRAAMGPIRSRIGAFPYARITEGDQERLREASRALKYERKQIRKMQRG